MIESSWAGPGTPDPLDSISDGEIEAVVEAWCAKNKPVGGELRVVVASGRTWSHVVASSLMLSDVVAITPTKPPSPHQRASPRSWRRWCQAFVTP